MNKTTRAKYELAEKMLKGMIPAEEVVMMTGLPLSEIKQIEEKVAPEVSKNRSILGLDNEVINMDILKKTNQ